MTSFRLDLVGEHLHDCVQMEVGAIRPNHFHLKKIFFLQQGRQLSGTMRDKMKRELQNNGADPNYSAGPLLGNPILIISAVIGVLVLLGGKGYFF